MNGRLLNVYAQQLEAYKTLQNSVLSGREIEAAALTRCAILLSDCQKNWDDPNRDNNLSEALRINQRVWSIFQSELTNKDNPLPKQLKEHILSLSVFIDKRIIQVMAHPVPEELKILIDINLNLAAGLRSKPAVELAAVS
jgi:flagellar biosynthesis activator protein FlaF